MSEFLSAGISHTRLMDVASNVVTAKFLGGDGPLIMETKVIFPKVKYNFAYVLLCNTVLTLSNNISMTYLEKIALPFRKDEFLNKI